VVDFGTIAGRAHRAGRELIEYVRAIVVMLRVTGVAAYLPARRALRIEPTRALRRVADRVQILPDVSGQPPSMRG
jgi:hypothetical protein